jgi:hypothetical protein
MRRMSEPDIIEIGPIHCTILAPAELLIPLLLGGHFGPIEITRALGRSAQSRGNSCWTCSRPTDHRGLETAFPTCNRTREPEGTTLVNFVIPT